MFSKTKKLSKVLKCALEYPIAKLFCLFFHIKNDDVWLISERGVDARDNGLCFYKYIKNNHPEIKVRFVITDQSSDAYKIDKRDLVKYGSFNHFVLFLTAGKLISTHIMGYSPDSSLFWRLDKKGLLRLRGKRIFLQHGVIYSYEPSLDMKDTKLDLFVASADKEKEFIISSNHYQNDIVKCSGLCRYDLLGDESSSKNKSILIMPTFRKWINYKNDIRNTGYFKCWNSLINNDRFIKYIESNNIKVLFYPHFEVQKHLKEFSSKSNNVTLCSFKDYDVQDLLKKANILITDYSSVQFDFAYMNKPIFYYQFDEEEFYKKHYKKGYFDFRKMGFGAVCTSEKDLLKRITSGEIKDYHERTESFFKHHDFDNSKRVFNEIMGICGGRG